MKNPTSKIVPKNPKAKPKRTENQQSLNQSCYSKVKGRVKPFFAYNME